MTKQRKPKAESWGEALNSLPDPVPGDNGEALERIVAFFRTARPELWDSIRLCPMQHGLEAMIHALKAGK